MKATLIALAATMLALVTRTAAAAGPAATGGCCPFCR
jgi:hypothetical protein